MDQLSEFLNRLLASHGGSGGPGFFQILAAMGVAYLGGVLSSFTPCVYPMIPITVGVIGGLSKPDERTGSHPWKRILFRSLAYLGGMILVYSTLGVLAGLTGRIFGSLTQTSGWYLGLGTLMTVAALAMMEVIPFDPAAWFHSAKIAFRKKFPPRSHAHGHAHAHPHGHPTHETETESLWGAAGLGASSGILSSPCTTPVLTVILAFIAQTQSVTVGLALMVGFSLGLGTLLIGISLFTGALQILPRSGKWMKVVKVASGLILLFFAEYLVFQAGTMRKH